MSEHDFKDFWDWQDFHLSESEFTETKFGVANLEFPEFSELTNYPT
ncbi:hypothetical protein [Adhaeribacter terrigena]|nr:hypothetical protein [Adhaeribacter terrigena]